MSAARPWRAGALVLGLAALVASTPAARAQSGAGAGACPYRDVWGNCTATPPFTPKKARAAQVIIIESTPDGADVWLDDERVGKTPVTIGKRLRSGSHALRLEKDRYVAHVGSVKVRTYGRQVFKEALAPWPTVRIERPRPADGPAARLRIDGRAHAVDAWPVVVQVSPGEHVFSVERPGYTPWESSVVLEPGVTPVFTPESKRITGTLVIETNLVELPVFRVPMCACAVIRAGYDVAHAPTEACPGTAEPWGRVGPAPLTKENLDPGSFCVEFRLAGLAVQRRLLSVSADQRSFYRFELPPPDKGTGEVLLNRFWGKWRVESQWARCRTPGVAAEQADACFRVGVVLQKDRQTPDLERAAAAYETACRAGSARACELFGWFVFNGRGGLEPDVAGGRAAYVRACHLGLERACYTRHTQQRPEAGAGTEDPSRYYRMGYSKTDPIPYDSLVYDSWVNARVSLWPTGLYPRHLPADWSRWNAAISFPFDIPLHIISQSRFLRGLAGDSVAVTVGWELGASRFLLPDETSRVTPRWRFVGGASLKLKFVAHHSYFAPEFGFNTFGPYAGGTLAYDMNVGGADLKVGVEITRQPTRWVGDGLIDIDWTARSFVSVGPAMGWLVDRLD